jgi:transcriptional regulator with XRE-family HTH domain
MDGETWDGRQLTAARALAGLTVRDLAKLAHTTKRIVSELETRGEIHVAETLKHGHVSRELWERIVAALCNAGAELLPEGRGHGAGVRWARQRADRVGLGRELINQD